MYPFFIHLSTNEHLVYFHKLLIVNNAAMNIGMHVSFQDSVFFRYIPRFGIAVPDVIFLDFLETSILFSTVAMPVYIPT